VVAAVVLVPACSSSDDDAEPATNPTTTESRTSTSAAAAEPLHVLVTNDDGYAAPGIDALVEALRKLPDTEVTVVAPAKNQSGTGGKTTKGPLEVTDETTMSGYPAKAVAGFPADTVVWAIDKKGIATRPDVVIAGVNFGQNLGQSIIDISGTVGAARAAARRGIPALAVSAGLADKPAYAIGAREAVAWLTEHRDELRDAPATVTNLNIPTCPTGKPRKVVVVPVAGDDENPIADVTCTGPAPAPTTDVGSFLNGYIVRTENLPLRPAA
jgi:5'-nucleotidase